MAKHRIYTTSFASVYPHYVAKAERKGRTKAEVDEILRWLTCYSQQELEAELERKTDIETFLAQAPGLNPNRALIKGVVCGVRVEEVEEPTMREIRYMDKLIDEARARAYLHANCGHCHRPGGWTPPDLDMDLRWTTPTPEANLCGVPPQYSSTFPADHRVAPGDPSDSLVWLRLSSRGPWQMPPFATSVPDPADSIPKPSARSMAPVSAQLAGSSSTTRMWRADSFLGFLKLPVARTATRPWWVPALTPVGTTARMRSPVA